MTIKYPAIQDKKVLEFRKDRDWNHFHTPKDQAISLMLEAAEVVECFQWKKDDDIKNMGEE